MENEVHESEKMTSHERAMNDSCQEMRDWGNEVAIEIQYGVSDSTTVGPVFDLPSSSAGQCSHHQSCRSTSSPERKSSLSDIADDLPHETPLVLHETNNDSNAKEMTELPVNIKMSANVASKLHQIHASLENLDYISDGSFEELEVAEVAGMIGEEPQYMEANRRSLGKTSLRQVFPHVSCLPFENNIVFCFVLSVWDNIVGPQTVYVWKRKSFPTEKTFDELVDARFGLVEIGDRNCGRVPGRRGSVDLDKVRKGYKGLVVDGDVDVKATKGPEVNPGHARGRGQKTKHTTAVRKMAFKSQSRHTVDLPNHVNNMAEEERNKSRSLGNLAEGQMDNKSENGQKSTRAGSIKESESQEVGGSWAYGRDRLRLGAVVKYVTEHSVGVGQVGPPSDKILSTLLVVPHQGIIIVALRFSVSEDGCGVPYCLSMVVPIEEYKYFMPLTHTVTTWLLSISAVTRLLITKYGLEGGGRIRTRLVELCETLVALRSASLDQYPLTPAGKPPDDRRVAEILLTSHLQTLGSTLVVADSPNIANKVVMWIAQFSNPADLHVSRLCLSYSQWSFHPGLAIQGVVRGANGEVNLSAQKLIQSTRPLTVFDANRGTVKQTGSPEIHARRNASALHQELLSLWHELPDVSAPSDSLLEPVKVAAPLIKQFLHDYDRLSSCEMEVRQNFIKAFLRSLQYTALALVTWTRQEWAVQHRRSGYSTLRQALCSVFDLDESDLRVVLAQAEQLQPGFYAYAMMC